MDHISQKLECYFVISFHYRNDEGAMSNWHMCLSIKISTKIHLEIQTGSTCMLGFLSI